MFDQHLHIALAVEQGVKKSFLFRIGDQLDGGVRRNFGQFPGLLDGGFKTAQAVHQLQIQALGPRPYAPLGDAAHLFNGQLAPLGHMLDEIVVDLLHEGAHGLFLLGGEVFEAAVIIGVFPGGNLAIGDAEQVGPEAAGVEFSHQHPDGTRERGWLGHDFVRRHGHPIAAGAGHVRHGHHHGFFLLRLHQLMPDQLGGDGASPGAVHAEDHGLDGGILARLLERLDIGFASHGGGAAEGGGGGFTHEDLAHAEDDGDLLAAGVLNGIVRVVHDIQFAARSGLDGVLKLVLEHQSVHQFRLEGVPGVQGGAVHGGAHGLGLEVPGGGDVVHQMAIDVSHQAFHHFAVGRCHRLLREGVAGRLVLGDVVEVGDDVELVQGAPQEHHLGVKAGQVEFPDGVEVHRVAGGGQIVGTGSRPEFPEGVGVAGRPFAVGLEFADQGAQFLNFPHAHGIRFQSKDHPGDVGIMGGLFKLPEIGEHRGLGPAQKGVQTLVGAELGDVSVQRQAQHGILGDGRLPEREIGGHREDDDEHKGQKQKDAKDFHTGLL